MNIKVKNILIGAGIVLSAIFYLHHNHVFLNITSSMPVGFYKEIKTDHLNRGDIVSVCLSPEISKEGIEKGYIHHGSCPDHSEPVLKKIIGLPEDKILRINDNVEINQIMYFMPKQTYDHNGNILKTWAGETHGFWIFGEHNQKLSWDSRYFGAVSLQNIQGVYKTILILN